LRRALRWRCWWNVDPRVTNSVERLGDPVEWFPDVLSTGLHYESNTMDSRCPEGHRLLASAR
jgi:hypothetical protein